MPFDRVDIYTQALNAAFVRAYDAIAEPPPIESAMTMVPSKGRIENYPWLYPPPLMHQWNGYRQYAKLGETNYRVPNITYTAEFECLFEDLEDDQIDGFKLQAAALARGARVWKSIASLQTLAAGQTTAAFDGVNFFANRVSGTAGAIGTGNNVFTATTAGTDGVTHAMVGLYTGNSMVRPLLWQNRQEVNFKTDAGSLEADKIRKVKWWSDLRGAAAYGFWWDAVLCKFANTPTVVEMQAAIGTMNARFKGFTYPKNLPTDANQYPHGQDQFSDANMTIVCSTLIDHILRQALTLSLIAQTENWFKGWARQITSGYLDSVT